MSDLSVTRKGQVTIPKDVRQKLGIRAGSKVQFRVVGAHAQLEVVSGPQPVGVSGAGMLPHRRPAVPAGFDVARVLAAKRGR